MTFVRRLTAWIALAAILLAALAPALAPLPVPGKAMPWGEICSVAGMQVLPDATPEQGKGQDGGKANSHCPLCLNPAGHLALPATPSAFLPALVRDAPATVAAASAPSSRPDWASPYSRAPPAAS